MNTLCTPLLAQNQPLDTLTLTIRRRHRNEFKKQFKQTAMLLYL